MSNIHINTLTIAILLAPPLAFAVAPDGKTMIDSRHGKVEVIAGGEAADILLAGTKIATVGAGSAALYPIASTTGPDYIVVRTSRPVAGCKHAFLLLALSDEAPSMSKEFGSCRELAGAAMSGAEPVVHLSNRADPQAGVESYRWQGSEVVMAFESPSLCSAAGFLAQKHAQPLPAPLSSRVSGSGRLQFLSAPDPACAMPGVFVVPGDSVTTSLASGPFVYANYTNPKSGRKVQGWVPRDRLAD
ncbi:hypothetical protein HF313_11435 [Massilia atriviolacea]|uniref:SH3 domain-containing protein n=1 Tax=Massilia atriviolacea TaxID=2495579 RepID=A0A430HIJ8_9BURK|nr:hypothetical protein [Massilia atriviolacea]RSZ57353.1 hypothetical protein EJB06_19560 [Massilia atriviolacea]